MAISPLPPRKRSKPSPALPTPKPISTIDGWQRVVRKGKGPARITIRGAFCFWLSIFGCGTRLFRIQLDFRDEAITARFACDRHGHMAVAIVRAFAHGKTHARIWADQ